MVGPVLYEASVPFFRKALQNQIQILKKGEAWCKENGHEVSDLSKVTLGPDMFALPFHVEFCTYNAVQLLVDLKVVDEKDGLDIENAELSVEQMIERLEKTLQLMDKADAAQDKVAGKEGEEIEVNLGALSVKRPALQYVHEISLPSFWFHHSMVYSILRAHGVPLTKQLYLSAW